MKTRCKWKNKKKYRKQKPWFCFSFCLCFSLFLLALWFVFFLFAAHFVFAFSFVRVSLWGPPFRCLKLDPSWLVVPYPDKVRVLTWSQSSWIWQMAHLNFTPCVNFTPLKLKEMTVMQYCLDKMDEEDCTYSKQIWEVRDDSWLSFY